ncbi:MAG: T9SS type A sorting domain-containing protein [Saprospiraceae bacterium]|nr:T9SS type A sorting domain-containing protein [Saprospiraceae bacterium]
MKTSAAKQFYYRLKMVDVDESFELSPVRSVRFDVEVAGFTVFPNPTSGELFLRPAAAIEGVVVVELTDVAGNRILRKTIDFQQDEAAVFDEGLLPGAGFYCLKIRKDDLIIWQDKVVVTGY